jgi:hypothetical protein
VATQNNLSISYPPSQDFSNGTLSNMIQLSISSIPDFQLSNSSFTGKTSLPGLDVTLSGNVVDQGKKSLSFTGAQINGFYVYNLTHSFDSSLRDNGEVPTLVVEFEKTTPPEYQLYV